MGSTLSQPNKNKKYQSGQNPQLKYSCVQMQGWQRQLESCLISTANIESSSRNSNSLFAIFDGFRGFQISFFLKQTFISVLTNSQAYIQGSYEQALRSTFEKIDQLILSQKGQVRLKQIRAENNGEVVLQNQMISDATGSTAAVVLITNKKIYAANLGDTKIFLMKAKKPTPLFQNHKPDSLDQKIRIQKAGGQVIRGRINGDLSISRGFGLNSYKMKQSVKWDQQMVTCSPQIKCFQRSISDSFILMGCNGIFQKFGSKAQDLVIKLSKSKQFQQQNFNECLQNVCNQSLAPASDETQYGYRNMAGILIRFNQI